MLIQFANPFAKPSGKPFAKLCATTISNATPSVKPFARARLSGDSVSAHKPAIPSTAQDSMEDTNDMN